MTSFCCAILLSMREENHAVYLFVKLIELSLQNKSLMGVVSING